MTLPAGQLSFGPVRCAWRAHRAGTPAEPLVRAWLGTLPDGPGADAVIARDARGRPTLAVRAHPGATAGMPAPGFDLNWSHSGERLLAACADNVRLGVDIELLRPRPKALALARRMGVKYDIMSTSFFLSRRSIKASPQSGMPVWQDNLYIGLTKSATDATNFFQIPTGRVVEVGTQVTV